MTGRDGVLVIWPNGPYDFVLDAARVIEAGTHPGWVVLEGFVVEPEGPGHQLRRSFYVRRIDAGYELMPANRDAAAIQAATLKRP